MALFPISSSISMPQCGPLILALAGVGSSIAYLGVPSGTVVFYRSSK